MKKLNAALIATVGAVAMASPAAAELPSVKFLSAPLISPADALSYYTASTTHSISVPGYSRAAEIKELANGLGKGQVTNEVYAQRAYEYVYNNIRIAHMFGMQKGPLGALVDQSGTAFDQASLMVELLREAGITANYQLGTISLSASQVNGWFGTTNAASACRLLADGGIPGTVNGSGSATCGMSGAVSSVTMLHVWVSALGNLYDPSFKVHSFKTGIDLSTATLCGANLSCSGSLWSVRSQARSAATSTANTTPITGSTHSIGNVSQAALEGQLTTWAMNLKSRIDAQHRSAGTADIVGGQSIDAGAMPTVGATLPYGNPAVTATWTEVPDSYRTTLRIQYDNINHTVYADETAGRRLRLAIGVYIDKHNPNTDPTTGLTALDRTVGLMLEWQELADSYRTDAGPGNDVLILAANHPYAANSGTYADDVIVGGRTLAPEMYWNLPGDDQEGPQPLNSYSAAIIQGWGQSGASAVSHFGALNAKEVFETMPSSVPGNITAGYRCISHQLANFLRPVGIYSQPNWRQGATNSGDPDDCAQSHRFARIAQWLSQLSRMTDLVGSVNSSVLLHHHSLGTIVWNNGINVESSVSTVSRTNVVGDRRATNYSFAVLSSRLEGGLAEQIAGAWDGESTVSSIARANEKSIRFGRFTTVSGFNSSGLYPPASSAYHAMVNSHITGYLNDGYALITPQSTPVQFTFPRYRIHKNYSNLSVTYVPETATKTVHSGFIAIRPSTADPTVPDRIAFLMEGYGGLFKGAASEIQGDDPVQSTMQTTQLQDASRKNRKYFGVDTGSGALRLTPSPDLVTGAAGFPLSLAFQRNYDSKSNSLPSRSVRATRLETLTDTLITSFVPQPQDVFVPATEDYLSTLTYAPNASMIGGGWDHNWHITAEISSDALQGMGEDSPIDAVATITALNTLRALTRAGPTFQETMSSVFVAHWFGTSLNDNAVVVSRPPSSSLFVRLPDGSFNPPNDSAEVLAQTNTKVPKSETTEDTVAPPNTLFDYRNVTFTLTDGAGSQLSFNLGEGEVTPNDVLGSKLFKATVWTFPTGARIDFAYAIGTKPHCLTSVSNNAGRSLTFTNEMPSYVSINNGTVNPAPHGQCYVKSVMDENGRVVSFSRPGATNALGQGGSAAYFGGMFRMPELRVTTPDGATTRYVYTDNIDANLADWASESRLTRVIEDVYAPTDHSNPFQSFAYDTLGRAKSFIDAQGQETRYSVGSYGGEKLRRGESANPLGAISTNYFDDFGKAVQNIDPLGRVTSSVFDGRQRLRRTVYPELNEVQFDYDLRGNELSKTIKAKPGSALPDIVTSATYKEGPSVPVGACANPATCNRVATTTDALGRVTTYDYTPSTAQLASITRPAVAEGIPQVNYCYTSYSTTSTPISLVTGVVSRETASKNRVVTYAYGGWNLDLSSATIDPANSLTPACGATTKAEPLALTTAFTFDVVGNVRTINGPRTDVSDVTTYTFDTMRRLTRVDAPLNSVTRYTYDLDGLVRTTRRARVANPVDSNPENFAPIDLLPAQWQTEVRDYLATGDLLRVTDAEGSQTGYAYDAAGRQRVVTDADGRQTATVYNLAGETMCTWRGGTGWTSSTAPADCSWAASSYDGTGPIRYAAYEYSPNGKQIAIQDANSNTTAYVYDNHDRLRYTFLPNPLNAALCSAPSDENGTASPTCVGTAPNVPTYEELWYSSNGQAATTPCSASSQPCRKRTRAGQSISMTYDALDRLSTKSPANQATVTTTYNLLNEVLTVGKPASGTYAAHTTTYVYDAAGRKSSEADTTNNRTVAYRYNNSGQRIRTTWPDGYFVTYDFDALGRMTYVREGGTTELAFYNYDILSRRDYLCLGGQSASCLSGAGTNKSSYTYETDSDLDVLSHVLNSTLVTLDYGRNNSHQITSIATSDDFYLPKPVVASSVSYAPNALNQYSSVSGQSSTYDLNGNLLTWHPSGGQQTYVYDSENRLVSAAINGNTSPSITYDYDALGRRASKNVDGATTTFLLDGDEEIAEYGGTTLLRRYITGPSIDERISRIEGTGATAVRTYYHVNHQGSVIAITDAAGTASARLSYDAYGRLASGSSATGEAFRYTGRRFDAETGLYYYRARYYSPDLGRFLQVDPIGYGDGMHLYAYVANDPLNRSDPTGMKGCAGSQTSVDKSGKAEGCTSDRATRDYEAPASSSDSAQSGNAGVNVVNVVEAADNTAKAVQAASAGAAGFGPPKGAVPALVISKWAENASKVLGPAQNAMAAAEFSGQVESGQYKEAANTALSTAERVAGSIVGGKVGALGGAYAPITVPVGMLVGGMAPNYMQEMNQSVIDGAANLPQATGDYMKQIQKDLHNLRCADPSCFKQ